MGVYWNELVKMVYPHSGNHHLACFHFIELNALTGNQYTFEISASTLVILVTLAHFSHFPLTFPCCDVPDKRDQRALVFRIRVGGQLIQSFLVVLLHHFFGVFKTAF
jgi:hypothetical protein